MRSILAILFAVLFFLPVAKGQGGEIYGTVKDSIGNPLKGVEVCVSSSKGFKQEIISDSNGYFSFKPIWPGSYNIEFCLKSYGNDVIEQVGIPLQGEIRMNKIMKQGSKRNISIYKKPLPRYSPPLKKL